ncbi:unnamed protein product [Orchesella dallaii]|uniref:Uncharacterized protein n=1 Tax=Orchesella dallaii TaxID=48710 RepID=A0ABP1QHB2_9HEXA
MSTRGQSRKCSFPTSGVVKIVLFIYLIPGLSSIAKTLSESDLGKTLTDVANKIVGGEDGKSPLSFLQSILSPNSTDGKSIFIPAGSDVPLLSQLFNKEPPPEFASDTDSKEENENDNKFLKVLAEINKKIFGGKAPDYKLVDSTETGDEETKDGDGTTYYD